MNYKIKTKDLLSSLQQTIKVVPTRSTLPILSCALFDFKDTLKISATNLETSINTNINIEKNEGESVVIAIPIGRLLEITSNIKDETIELVVSNENKVNIITQNGTFSITGQDYKEFPSDPVMNESTSLSLNMNDFIEIIDFTKNSISRDELKPALQGVLLKITNNQITGVSTDGHRLSRIIIENNNDHTKDHEIIVPIKFLTLLSSFIDKKNNIELEISENYISISHKNQTVFSRIIKDTYPDYEKVIPPDNNKTLMINKKELLEAIKRVSIFSNKSTKQITLQIEKQTTTIKTEDIENAATGKEKIKSNFSEEEELKIGFNANFITDALNNITNENITIFLNSPLSAAIITEKEEKTNKDKLLLLMPIRLND